MRTYIIFFACRYIALATSVKVRIGSPKMARKEQVCAHQITIQEVNFSKYLCGIVYRRDCGCAPVLRFFSAASDGAIADRQIANRTFSSI